MPEALAALRPPDARNLPRREGGPKGLNVLGTLAHHPAAARAFLTFNGYVLFASTLTPRERELVVLRVAALRRAQYEWAQHVVLAREAGLSDPEIARVAAGADAGGWSRRERAMLEAVDELVRDAGLSTETWEVLADELDVQQIVDLVFTVGAYETLAMLLGAFRVEPDDDVVAACGNDLLIIRDW